MIQYLYTLDQIITTSDSYIYMPINVVSIYVQCYCESVRKNEKARLEELKIIRKLWHLHLAEKEIALMKSSIMKIIKHDIDIFVQESSINFFNSVFSK